MASLVSDVAQALAFPGILDCVYLRCQTMQLGQLYNIPWERVYEFQHHPLRRSLVLRIHNPLALYQNDRVPAQHAPVAEAI